MNIKFYEITRYCQLSSRTCDRSTCVGCGWDLHEAKERKQMKLTKNKDGLLGLTIRRAK